jgi:hypothetical protein
VSLRSRRGPTMFTEAQQSTQTSVHENVWIGCFCPSPLKDLMRPPRPGILLTTILLTAVGLLLSAAPADATPPGIPTGSTAPSELATLTVAAWTHTTTYQRSLFPTWDTITGTCDTRETVLKRDGVSVVVNTACDATSGTWHSPYAGATWTAASDVDIDHMVTLKNAWSPVPGDGRPAKVNPSPTTWPTRNCSPSPTTSTNPEATSPRTPGNHH